MSTRFFGFNTTQAKTLEDRLAELEAENTSLTASVANLNAWATALATKLNADATAQNALAAFPLTLDTNYDTNPQA
jgi:hypothetical protein